VATTTPITAPRSRGAERRPRGGGRPPRRLQLRPSGLPWILPALVLVVGLLYYCIGYTGYISTLTWNGTDLDKLHVGLANYVSALKDPVFWKALFHTAVYFVTTFVIQTALGVFFALFLHSKIRLATIYKIVLFVPVVLAPAVMAPVFRQVFAADGQFNFVLDHIGLGSLAQPWLAQSSTALPVIMSITIWEWTGLTFILYYAAMGQIEPEMLEAARLDGAGNLRVLWSIIWPSLRGTTTALLMLSAISALKTFDVPYLVTVGGPNYSTEFLGTLIYRQSIPQSNVGYGAALSILLLILALGLAIVLQLAGRERKAR
jgi:raffinose/stachyose/melibiose transport system permease protein